MSNRTFCNGEGSYKFISIIQRFVNFIDNFFGGEKVSDPAQRDPKTVALREAGKSLKNQVDLWVTSLIPVGDGLLLATKL